MPIDTDYSYHGHRVMPKHPIEIESIAKLIKDEFGITKEVLNNIESFIDKLWCEHSINVEILEDKKWLNFSNALCDPPAFTVVIPYKILRDMKSKSRKKTKDKIKAFSIFFHELGHICLSHKAMLHHSDSVKTKYEDSEWQADYFSDVMMTEIGEPQFKQLVLI